MTTSLLQLRKSRKLSLRELGKELDLHWTTLNSYERGRRTPDMETADKIALFFGVTIEDIFPKYKRQSSYPKSTPASKN